jgi:hypothetical protein
MGDFHKADDGDDGGLQGNGFAGTKGWILFDDVEDLK